MPPMVAFHMWTLGVDDLVERLGEAEREIARLTAELDRLRCRAASPVSWASPAGPAAPRPGQPVPGGAGPEADGEEATP